jgi:hypothetical protein
MFAKPVVLSPDSVLGGAVACRPDWRTSPNSAAPYRADILAFIDHHASIGPTEAINGRLEAVRRNALGFRNLTNYRWRSLLHSGALHQLVNAL